MSKRKLTWEYTIKEFEIGDKIKGSSDFTFLPRQHVQDTLNKAGGEGWDIVSVFPSHTYRMGGEGGGSELIITLMVVMKRPRLVE